MLALLESGGVMARIKSNSICETLTLGFISFHTQNLNLFFLLAERCFVSDR